MKPRVEVRLVLALALATLAPVPAAGETPAGPYATAPAHDRPRFRDLRFEEDWQGLGSSEGLASRDFFDPIKYVPIGSAGESWLGFGGELRARAQAHDDFRLGAGGAETDDVFGLFRMRLHGDLHLGPHLRVFAEIKSALASDRDLPGGRSPGNTDEFALQNGFVALRGPWAGGQAALRLGRQELRFGRERLVSAFDWSNVRRTFDGASAIWRRDDLQVHAFFALPVRVASYARNDHESGRLFYGVDVRGRLGAARLEAYAYGHRREDVVLAGAFGTEQRGTLGARLRSRIPGTPLDGELEVAGQFGSLGGADLRTFMVASELGWWMRELPLSPRLHLGFDAASGDDGAGSDVGTFDPLFPNGNRYFGVVDLVGRRNLLAASVGASLRVAPRLRLRVEGFYFWRARRGDAWYDAAGNVLRPAAAGRSRALGGEVDVTLHFQLDPHTDMALGYGHFLPGSFARQSGPSDAAKLLYAWVRFRI